MMKQKNCLRNWQPIAITASFLLVLGFTQSSAAISACASLLGATFSEKITGRGGFSVISNEAGLYRTLPHVRSARGAGLGVGSDQMLDFAVNSALSRIYIMDISPHVSHTTRAILEVGRIHKLTHNRPPTPAEYVDYFSPSRITSTLKALKQEFTAGEFANVEAEFATRLKRKNETSKTASGPLAIFRYLQYKVSQSEYASWVSSTENINRTLEMYDRGDIVLVVGDLAGPSALNAIAANMRSDGLNLGLVYLSNAEHYVGRKLPGFESGDYDQYQANMANMPVTNDTIFISTNQIGSRTSPKPQDIQSDPYLNDHFLDWEFFLQTNADRNLEKQGHYTATFDGQIYKLDRLDRLYQHQDEGGGYGIREPSPGIFLAGFGQ